MNFLLNFHARVLETAAPALGWMLKRRLAQGKEDGPRLGERRGEPGVARPSGPLIWIHGASVGEAQSTLIIIEQLKQHFPQAAILLTTGTVSSARYLESRLPAGVIHQYYPVDRPRWVEGFLTHWQPDFVLWMESELWPAMLCGLQRRKIPVALVNGRMSPRSLKRWKMLPQTARILLQTFTKILVQTENDAAAYRSLGGQSVVVSGNLKYAAQALPADDQALITLKAAIADRPVWLFASTHKGEEDMACRVHKTLAADLPDLLTVIVPRHPERRDEIMGTCQQHGLNIQLRTDKKNIPASDTQIYIADTLGELGLFYRICPIACIGRSFSDDGGGGHNPIEAAQLRCAVLHGPNVQNLIAIYNDMDQAGAARLVMDEQDLVRNLKILLSDEDQRRILAQAGFDFTQAQCAILGHIMGEILPLASSALNQKDRAA